MAQRFALFATTTRGTEDLLAEELTALGAQRVRQDRGGVRFMANLLEALRICLWTRIAMRVLWPLGDFKVVGAEGLYQAAAQVPWEEHLNASTTFAVDATLKDSEHDHSGFVALKIKDAVVDRLREKLGARPDVDTRNPAVRIVAHISGQQLSLSLDLVGEPLNRRGYRVEPTGAPLKETLAAAILRAANYTGQEPLVDPMCGSGTLVIEAALIAQNRAPNLDRPFAAERWPQQGPKARELLAELRAEARAQQGPAPFPIWGFDRDEEALEASRKNISAAGLNGVITLGLADATLPLPIPSDIKGLLVTNPPYGDRLTAGGQKGMKTFYYKLGESLGNYRGLRMAILSGNEAFESAFHKRPFRNRSLFNGPIACELLAYAALDPA